MTRKGIKEFAMRNIKSYFISLLFTILLLILTACGEEQKSIVTEDESQKQVLEQVSMQLTSEQPTSVLLVSDEPTKANVTPEPENTSYDFTIGFAGADVIIGAHPHVLQGLEYYDNKPIFYSLGNYWFNSKTLDTMLVELHFYEDEEGKDILDCRIIPGIQENCQTRYASSKEEQRRIFDFLESHSSNVKVDDEGYLQNSSIR